MAWQGTPYEFPECYWPSSIPPSSSHNPYSGVFSDTPLSTKVAKASGRRNALCGKGWSHSIVINSHNTEFLEGEAGGIFFTKVSRLSSYECVCLYVGTYVWRGQKITIGVVFLRCLPPFFAWDHISQWSGTYQEAKLAGPGAPGICLSTCSISPVLGLQAQATTFSF